jgi:hypothetical protein
MERDRKMDEGVPNFREIKDNVVRGAVQRPVR